MADSQTPQGYAAQRRHEIDGTGFASPHQTSWPVQQAAARQQEQLSAQQAAARDKAAKARQNWTPAKNPYAGRKGR